MVNNRDFAVATASQLRGSMPPPPRQTLSIETQQSDMANNGSRAISQLQRTSAIRRSARVGPSTTAGCEQVDNAPEALATDIFTQSPHASRGSLSSIGLPLDLRLKTSSPRQSNAPVLQPVTYSPPSPQRSDERVAAAVATGIIRSDTVRHKVGVLEYSNRALPQIPQAGRIVTTELQFDTDNHKRNLSNSSTSSTSSSDRPRRKKASPNAREIYFTPTDVNSSKTFLSSPLNSPTLPGEYLGDDDDGLPTPRASVSASLTHPPSAIYVGISEVEQSITQDQPEMKVAKSQAAIQISPQQLDKLVVALVRSKVVRKHLQKDWFDLEDVPDDESVVSSFSTISLPTLTSASTLYSRQNENSSPPLLGNELPRYSADDPSPTQKAAPAHRRVDGIVISDPKVYGTPAKYVSCKNAAAIGTRTFLSPPDGSEIECSLRLEAPSASNGNSNVRVLLQCINQIVDRKSGKNASILSAEIDVTEHIAQAALAELAEGTSLRVEDIAVCPSPTSSINNNQSGQRSSILSSTTIDWIAVADDLQNRDYTANMIDTAIGVFANLDADTASMSTLSLLSRLTRLADQHQDLLILKPTSYHKDARGNSSSSSIPHTIKIPHCSKRLYEDWYTDPRGSQAGEKVGESEAARLFQRGIVSSVAKRAGETETFKIEVSWEKGGRVRQVLRVVPMCGGKAGEERVWCCFVVGEWDLSP
ncbi:hypothetical protein Slin15195_G064920 [Septoria linicola]|uniref:Uncharacterized protein n=1 Tax=Septoria linicola TaxID=215465 RepID=A0A9Q9AW35_9PEZI|nr:hypothetical protein Slin14017_G115260 [Septoria linicola]USW53173.1 hypothetical protein Slin15195_G064920 [Septoria linicola]